FPYVVAQGNLCWEMRIKNNTVSTAGYNDATNVLVRQLFGPLIGAGCLATGQTGAATIGTRSLNAVSGAVVHQLDRGSFLKPAPIVFGAVAQPITLPGLCSSLQTVPVLAASGSTDPTGSWRAALTFGSLLANAGAQIYVQFAFLDAGLSYGFGLSPCSPITL